MYNIHKEFDSFLEIAYREVNIFIEKHFLECLRIFEEN